MPTTRKVSSPKRTEARAALRAYHIYLERGGAPGDELDDWTRAERELLASNGQPSRKPKSKAA
jgi:hypothetical protein